MLLLNRILSFMKGYEGAVVSKYGWVVKFCSLFVFSRRPIFIFKVIIYEISFKFMFINIRNFPDFLQIFIRFFIFLTFAIIYFVVVVALKS